MAKTKPKPAKKTAAKLPKLKMPAKHKAALEIAAPYLLTACLSAFDMIDNDNPPKGKDFARVHNELSQALQIFEDALK